MPNRVPMTPEGKRKLEEKLKHLKTVDRPENIADIEEAREKGDLSENAEYDAAKNRQGLIFGQIQDVESKLSLALVIDPKTIRSEKIAFGATVDLTDIDNDETVSYQIVGIVEADIRQNRVSIESPIARALIGKEEGDEVQVKTPKGIRNFEVNAIEYK